MHSMFRLLLVVAVLLVSVPASAVLVTYGWTSGEITVQARQSSDNALVFDETLLLSSASFLVWDAFGVPSVFGTGTIDDFLLRIQPNQGPFATLIPYGPFDEINIDSGDVFAGLGFGTTVSFNGSVDTEGIDIDAYYTASNSVSGATSGSTPADITNVSNMSATLNFLDPSQIQLSVFGVVMGTVDGTPFGQAGNDLNLTANITLFADAGVVPTPEPSTGLLVALGLVGLTVVRRSRNAA